MPESRLAKTRATLPSGYQFGDAHAHFWGDFPQDPVTGLFRCKCGETKTLWQIFISLPAISTFNDWNLDSNINGGN